MAFRCAHRSAVSLPYLVDSRSNLLTATAEDEVHLADGVGVEGVTRTVDVAGTCASTLMVAEAKRFDTVPYGFGETRPTTLALLIFTTLSGWCS
jgi:hypothetical protein